MNPKIIRVGDTVKIIVPKLFVRCGYSMCPEIESNSIRREFGKEINDLLVRIGVKENQDCIFDQKYLNQICQEIAYAKCKSNRYGGRDRQIFTQEDLDYKDSVLKVTEIKYVRTGKYEPASYGCSYDGNEYDPPVLCNVKTHKILRLRSILIEAANVEKCL